MSEPIFECANIPVAVASKALKVDCQTVRLLLQSGAANWGIAYHRTPKSRMRRYAILEELQTEHSGDEYFYRGIQKEMDALDEQAEHIRGILEGRWDE